MASDERAAIVLAEGGHAWTLEELQEDLAAQGLHVVTDAEMRVLEACAKEGPIRAWAADVWRAERARREGK